MQVRLNMLMVSICVGACASPTTNGPSGPTTDGYQPVAVGKPVPAYSNDRPALDANGLVKIAESIRGYKPADEFSPLPDQTDLVGRAVRVEFPVEQSVSKAYWRYDRDTEKLNVHLITQTWKSLDFGKLIDKKHLVGTAQGVYLAYEWDYGDSYIGVTAMGGEVEVNEKLISSVALIEAAGEYGILSDVYAIAASPDEARLFTQNLRIVISGRAIPLDEKAVVECTTIYKTPKFDDSSDEENDICGVRVDLESVEIVSGDRVLRTVQKRAPSAMQSR